MSDKEWCDYVIRTCREVKASCERLLDYRDLMEEANMPPSGAAVIMGHAMPELANVYDKLDRLQSDVAGWAVVHCIENK